MRTRTASPGLKRAGSASAAPIAHFFHHPAEVLDRDHAALEQALRHRVHPALVVAHLAVDLGAEVLDHSPALVDLDQLPVLVPEQHGERVAALLPVVALVLVAHDPAGG